jgi:4-amino-4-deoxy-L-arabinose transferase-like glycosyltransferase
MALSVHSTLTKNVPALRFFYLALILLLAALLRLYGLADFPVAFNQDEAVNGYDAFCIFHTLRDHHGNFLPCMLQAFNDWNSPLLTYLTAPFVGVAGLSEWSVRLPLALMGVLSIWLFYLLVKKLFRSEWIALFSALCLSIMPWHIHASRFAIPPSCVPCFFILLLLLFWGAVNNASTRSYIRFVGVGIGAGLLAYAYPTQKLFAPMALLIGVLVFGRGMLRKHVAAGASFLVLTAPMYLLTMLDPQKYNGRFSQVSLFGLGGNIAGEFLTRFVEYLSPSFLFGSGDPDIVQKVPGQSVVPWFLFLFCYLGIGAGICQVLWKPNIAPVPRKFTIFLLLLFLASPIPASLTSAHLHSFRSIQIAPLALLFCMFGVFALVHLLEHQPRVTLFIGIVLFSLAIYRIAGVVKSYFVSYPAMSKIEYGYGIKATMKFLLAHKSDFSCITVDSRANQPYIYYLFYSRYDPRKLQYSAINAHPAKPGEWLDVDQIGKFHFRQVTDDDLRDARVIYRVSDRTQPYAEVLYKKDRGCFAIFAFTYGNQ